MSGNTDNNGKVTLAVLSEKIDSLTGLVRERLEDHEDRLRDVERTSSANSQKLGLFAGAQAAFSVLVAAVAGWIGATR